MSRQVILNTRPGSEHPEARLVRVLVQSVLDDFETRKAAGAPPSFSQVRVNLLMALDASGGDDRDGIAGAICHGEGDVTLEGNTGAARIGY